MLGYLRVSHRVGISRVKLEIRERGKYLLVGVLREGNVARVRSWPEI